MAVECSHVVVSYVVVYNFVVMCNGEEISSLLVECGDFWWWFPMVWWCY